MKQNIFNIELDSDDISTLISVWIYLGYLLGKETRIGNRLIEMIFPDEEAANRAFLACGNDCFKNIEIIFTKHGIPKKYALNCFHNRLQECGIEPNFSKAGE